MKLKSPFIQLPITFDAGKLLSEINSLGPAGWREHPQKYPGNFALPLISVNGNTEGDGFAGPMRPTPFLEKCPYLMQVLEKLGAVWGRSRLMKLSGHAEVTPHVDVNYYWRERVRVHIPVLTTPDVRFICGDDEVNMKEGECWLFDTWRMHRVINAANRERIHLVADTVGSDVFWQMAEKGRIPSNIASQDNWQPENFGGSIAPSLPSLAYESKNLPTVMTPWELKEILHFLLHEAKPHEQLEPTRNLVHRFITQWQALWTQYGDEQVAWPRYREMLNSFEQAIVKVADSLVLVNGSRLIEALRGLVLWSVLGDRKVGLFARGAGKAS